MEKDDLRAFWARAAAEELAEEIHPDDYRMVLDKLKKAKAENALLKAALEARMNLERQARRWIYDCVNGLPVGTPLPHGFLKLLDSLPL